ncbi:hypothetical protein BTJ68_08557 [Hortaea werneckii EXF-2000]|uniref:diacylglycerol O-acyltransferase n=2 Tax=Hortaea werneckii TaxID=91943 RepID=A0A3M7HTK1_HORWE|nr:hypothetical protein BTJ68_08557 [Hortaea werneckii EXF-2000]RMZ16549.1 hypothetical protein D0860_00944 [Hortaea werneckii]RMZ32630.1 hypothetical protein D0859_03255 [Hortaea werneckii]
MSLHPSLSRADPTDRQQHSPFLVTTQSKSYADVAVEEEAPEADTSDLDEDSIALIKESPPRPSYFSHTRQPSEPRPFGEVIDEEERSSRPSSPSLRHPKGRLEDRDGPRPSMPKSKKNANKGGSYAGVVKDNESSKENQVLDGNGVPPAALDSNVNGHVNGHQTPETYEGSGKEEAPSSSSRKALRRGSKQTVNDDAPEQPQDSKIAGENGLDGNTDLVTQAERSQQQSAETGGIPAVEGVDDNADGQNAEPGQLIYENLTNRSGENLATVKPFDDYRLALQQRENKPDSSEPTQQALKTRGRSDSELVSGRRAGAGWSQSAIRWAPLNIPLQRRLQTVMVLVHTLSIAAWLSAFFLLCTVPLLWPVLVPYLIYVLVSQASVDGKLAYRNEWLRSMRVWSLFASYFPARLHRSQTLEPTRKYIFGYHPHGIISHGAFAAFGTEALGFSQLFPGITNTLLTLDSNFRIPLYRDYALRMGLASVSRESCENLLSQGGPNGEGMGRAITIVVGGARESLDAKPYSLKLVLKRRKGFVKLAIRTGADLVPVLAFGENDLYEQFDASAHPIIHKAQLVVKKLMGFTVPLFHARGVFNYDVGLMPYRRPVNIVVGKPIRIQQAKNPDPAYVDQIHQQYVDELMRIWDDWKDTFARHRQTELEIVE